MMVLWRVSTPDGVSPLRGLGPSGLT